MRPEYNPYDSFNAILEEEHQKLRTKTTKVVKESMSDMSKYKFIQEPIPCPFLRFVSKNGDDLDHLYF